MKSSNKFLYLQWFAIGVFITLACVVLAMSLTHYLTKRDEEHRRELMVERNERKMFGPILQRLEIMRFLVYSEKATPEEAFRIVDKAQEAPFPEATFLLNENRQILDSHLSKTYKEGSIKDFQEHEISAGRYYRIYVSPPPLPTPGPAGPPPSLRPPLPKGLIVIGAISIGVSIVIGIGFSLVLLTLYLRKRAHKVEDVMDKIKHGDLKARFNVGHTDGAGLLMVRFNEMADEIERLVANLRDTEESRKKMLQELAHDLRTPVASMKMLQETLFNNGHGMDPEQKAHFQRLAMKEVAYFERLVEDLLFLSGVNDPRYGQQLTKVDLSDLIQQELEVFDVGRVNVHFTPEKVITIEADEHLLRRLLKNAFSNAARFARKNVFVELSENGKGAWLTVRDDGPGLKEDELHDFGEKKYSRQLREDESDYISIGLGSVIMKKIMNLHNGFLTIKNTSPGAKLELFFPS